MAQHDDRQRVLEATDIVRLIGEHLAIRPKGREYVCLCPFHDDHKPSMYVVPHKQIYHCFVCGAGGNAIDFAMNYHKMSFREALKLLAEQANIELTPLRPRKGAADGAGEGAGEVSRESIADANRFALDFFRTILRHPEHGAEARAAVERRGISPDMVEAFEIGAAPDRWDGLVRTVESRGMTTASFEHAGLLKARSGSAGLYDAMRHRLIFPIHDQVGRVVAFGGRKLREEDEPKYLNSPESPLFDKSSTLFGLRQAFRAIQRERLAAVVEGYTDVIACHQGGVQNVVATLGTALTPVHAAVLKRLCDTVVLVFDGDDAGMKASDRAVEVFFAQPVDVKIAVLPGGVDPADLLAQEGGADAFRAAITGAVDALEFRFARMRDRLAPMGASGRARAIEEDMAALADLGMHRLQPIRRQLVVRRLARIAGVDEATIVRAMPRSRARRHTGAGAPDGATEHGGAVQRERRTPLEHALGCLLCDPTLARLLDHNDTALFDPGLAPEGPARVIASALFGEDAGDEPSLASALAAIDDDDARRAATAIAVETERITDRSEARLKEHWHACLRALRMQRDRRAVAPPGPDAGAKSAGADSLARLSEALESRRRRHVEHGGDPLAMPRPVAPAAKGGE